MSALAPSLRLLWMLRKPASLQPAGYIDWCADGSADLGHALVPVCLPADFRVFAKKLAADQAAKAEAQPAASAATGGGAEAKKDS